MINPMLQGLMLEVVGPTLPDLKDHVGANYEEISRALATKSAGLFLGAFIGGVLHEKFHRHTDLIMSLGILIGAVGITMVPWVPTLPAVSFFLMLTGIGEGFINTGGSFQQFAVSFNSSSGRRPDELMS